MATAGKRVEEREPTTSRAMADKNGERTYIMVKPDGVERGLTGEIIKRFEQKGFKMVAMKFMQVKKL